MAKMSDHLSEAHRSFIGKQKIFFTGSAPLDGHVNVSPKGMNCLRVLSSSRVAYLDFTGSGNETAAHLLENGRITVMFCSFETPADPSPLRSRTRDSSARSGVVPTPSTLWPDGAG